MINAATRSYPSCVIHNATLPDWHDRMATT